ncbi:MAG: hypothetical protein ACFB21_13115, partial [Opitutales bacterium]
LAFSVFAGLSLNALGVNRPAWALCIASFFAWALLETLYNWLWIKTISRSDLPLFVRWSENTDGDEWPVNRRSLLMRDWLRANGFRKLTSVKADLGPFGVLRSSLYENPEDHLRCQILFFPQASGSIQTAHQLMTRTKEGELVVTDNSFLPSAAYWPNDWFVERHPLVRSLPKLARKHRRRLREFAVEPAPWPEGEAVVELNEHQRILERLNLRRGFLQPYERREENGRITRQGRYRLWKEIWLLNYFGSTIHDD